MSSELQKIGDISFRIQDSNMDMGFLWKDGELYLAMHNVMLTDGNIWYEMPIKDLKDIEVRDGSVSFVVENMSLEIRGRSAERLLALRHLLLPLIEGRDEGGLEESVVKLVFLDIKDPEIMASLLKRSVDDIMNALDKAEKEGLISDGRVTEKGMSFLPEDDREILRRAGEP